MPEFDEEVLKIRKEIIAHIRAYQKNLSEEYLSELDNLTLLNHVHPSDYTYYGKMLFPGRFRT